MPVSDSRQKLVCTDDRSGVDMQMSIEQVAGILQRAGLTFETRADGDAYRLPFDDGDAVFVLFDDYGDGVRVYLSSPVLDEIEPSSAGEAATLNALNGLNKRFPFMKFVYDDGTLLAVHDLLGDELRGGDLLNAVHAIATAADTVASELEESTGGKRWEEVMEESERG